MTKPALFVFSSLVGLPVARELAHQLTASSSPTLWPEGVFQPGRTVSESLTEVAERADFAVFVLTSDAMGIPAAGGPPRVNLIFELGFVAGRIGLDRTFLVVVDPQTVSLPTDLAGAMYFPVAPMKDADLGSAVAPAVAAIRKVVASVGRREPGDREFSSCFISYSWHDKDFAAQLHDDLQKVGVRSWLDIKEMKAGVGIAEQLDRAIQAHDKVLLVLSAASVDSAWVRLEVRHALELEVARNATVLFPINIDDAIFTKQSTPEIERLRQRYFLDFTHWQNKNEYQRAFSKLVRDLAISSSVESAGNR